MIYTYIRKFSGADGPILLTTKKVVKCLVRTRNNSTYIYTYSTLPRVREVDKLVRIELCYVTYKGETYTVNKNAGVVSKVPYEIPPLFVQFTVQKN